MLKQVKYYAESEGAFLVSAVKTALLEFSEKYIKAYEQAEVALAIEFDVYGSSPCITRSSGDTAIWQPTQQDMYLDFTDLERGMEVLVHDDFVDYFCCLWSDHLNANAARGGLQLLMVWNQDDFIRLQENLIAHLLMKRRLGQRDTLFFAQTEDENFILSILNETGEVVLEPVGQEPREVLAKNLTEFIGALTPVVV